MIGGLWAAAGRTWRPFTFDRHIDTLERDMDERMHTGPKFHATNIPNCPPSNLVQVGIGGLMGNRSGIKVARERDTTVISIFDVDEWGIDKCVDAAQASRMAATGLAARSIMTVRAVILAERLSHTVTARRWNGGCELLEARIAALVKKAVS